IPQYHQRVICDVNVGMFKYGVIHFLQTSQVKRWEKITAIHGSDTENRVIQRLYKELDLRGSQDVLRNGFVDYGVRFQMAYFRPASGLNPVSADLYHKNEMKVYRQVYYNSRSEEHTSELQSRENLVCRLLLEK